MNKNILSTCLILLTGLNLLSAQSNIDKKSLEAINKFNDEVFLQLNDYEQNVFFSSVSIYNLLYALLQGSGGTTAKEIADTININPNENNEFLEKVLTSIDNMTNSIWYQKSYKINKDYIAKINKLNFKQNPVDFRKSTSVTKKINNFISKNTDKMIPNFLQQDLPSDTKLILLNTLCFEQKWENEFQEENTHKNTFYISKTEKIQKDMMNASFNVLYFENKDFKIIKLPYKNNRYSMIIYLPNDISYDFSKIKLSELTDEFLSPDKSIFTKVDISLPKFETDMKVDLIPILNKMGINLAFTPNSDISKIFSNGQKLFVDTAIHQAKISVNEKETKAAAVTMFGLKAMAMPPVDKKEFIANHPFCYTIYDEELNINLFSGIIRNPK